MPLARLKRLFNRPFNVERMVLSGRWRQIWQDLLLWSVVGVFVFWQIPQWLPQGPQAILLRFKDSSELGPGSPVRLMGKEVGWVQAVKFKRDHVQVRLSFYRDAPHIPPQSEFTIEFTGIAGAKCVEITPPHSVLTSTLRYRGKRLNAHFNGRRDENHYVVVEPIRMADVQKGGLLQVEAMQEGSENMARFLDPEDNPTEYNLAANRRLLRMLDERMATGTTVLTGAATVAQRYGTSLDRSSAEIVQTLDNYDRSLRTLNTRPLTQAPQQLPRQLRRLRRANASLNRLRQTPLQKQTTWALTTADLEPVVVASQHTLPTLTQGLSQTVSGARQVNQSLPTVKQRIQQFAVQAEQLKNRLTKLNTSKAQNPVLD